MKNFKSIKNIILGLALSILLSSCIFSDKPGRISVKHKVSLKAGIYEPENADPESKRIIVQNNKIGFDLSNMYSYKAYQSPLRENNFLMGIRYSDNGKGTLYIPFSKYSYSWPTIKVLEFDKNDLYQRYIPEQVKNSYSEDEIFTKEALPSGLENTYNLGWRLSKTNFKNFLNDFLDYSFNSNYEYPSYKYAYVQSLIINIKNTCTKDIRVAISYTASQNGIDMSKKDKVVQGWTNLKSGESKRVKLFNAIILRPILSYAESFDGSLMWGKNYGSSKPSTDSLAFRVRSKKFGYVNEWPYLETGSYVNGTAWSLLPDNLSNYDEFPGREIGFGCK